MNLRSIATVIFFMTIQSAVALANPTVEEVAKIKALLHSGTKDSAAIVDFMKKQAGSSSSAKKTNFAADYFCAQDKSYGYTDHGYLRMSTWFAENPVGVALETSVYRAAGYRMSYLTSRFLFENADFHFASKNSADGFYYRDHRAGSVLSIVPYVYANPDQDGQQALGFEMTYWSAAFGVPFYPTSIYCVVHSPKN